MRKQRPIAPLKYSPTLGRVFLGILFSPLAIALGSWSWSWISPETLWQVANAVRPFSSAATRFVAMPGMHNIAFPVFEFIYALMLVGWALAILLYSFLLFRFRRHIPAWLRSKAICDIEKMRAQKRWALPTSYVIWSVMLLDILIFGEMFRYAELGMGNGHPSFGASMFRLGGTQFIFYLLSVAILQEAIVRFHRDKSPIEQPRT